MSPLFFNGKTYRSKNAQFLKTDSVLKPDFFFENYCAKSDIDFIEKQRRRVFVRISAIYCFMCTKINFSLEPFFGDLSKITLPNLR